MGLTRLLLVVLLLPTLIIFRRLRNWYKHYRIACKTGLPLIVIPFSWQDPLWLIFRRRLGWLGYLPIGSRGWIKYGNTGWSLHDKYETHKQLGDAFVLVSPTMCLVMVAEPNAATEIFSKYKKWQRPKELYRVFDLFGPNVASVNGEDWQRHRKVAAQGFREQNYELVWQSATKQARQMMETMPQEPLSLKKVNDKINTITMHVLSYAGFGHDYDFNAGLGIVPAGHKKSFADTMTFLLLNIVQSFLLKLTNLPERFMTTKWQSIKVAERELSLYFKESLDSGKGDLVNSILEANAEAKKDSKSYLSQEEMYGNLFLLQLAGFETTSSALQLSLARIAAEPELQDWIMAGAGKIADYISTFPRQVRCLAVMYETLRYYGTTPELVRFSTEDQTLQVGDREVFVPAGVYVSANVTGIHYNSEHWGSDVNEYKPSRWIEDDAVNGEEKLKDAPEHTIFIPWTIGPRVCPGKKFSQVEFVAALLTILENYRITASENVVAVVGDFEFRVGLHPKNPEAASLKFVKSQSKVA